MNQKVIAEYQPKVLTVESKKGLTIVYVEKKTIEAIIIRELKDLKEILDQPTR